MPKHNRKLRLVRIFSVLAVITALSALTTIVYAALKMTTGSVVNTFTAESQPSLSIIETVTEDSENEGYILKKENVTVKNSADYSVFIRAAVVITWQDADGKVYTTVPSDEKDYSITFNTTDWTKDTTDGYWYYKEAVAGNASTSALITSCEPLKAAPVNGYTLHVNIISQSIQSAGTTDSGNVAAIKDAWNRTA